MTARLAQAVVVASLAVWPVSAAAQAPTISGRAPTPPASAPASLAFGSHTLTGPVPPGFQLIDEVSPDATRKLWVFAGQPGPDGIRPIIQIGWFVAPAGVAPLSLQNFGAAVADELRNSYGGWIGQYGAPTGERLRLEWSGLLRRQTDAVAVRGLVHIGAANGAFYRLLAYDSAGPSLSSLPAIDAALAAFSVGAPIAALTREQRWAVCAESTDKDAAIAQCTALTTSPEESAVNRGIAFYNRGNLHATMDGHVRAIADFDEAIRLNPAHHQAFNSRGIAYQSLSQHARAIEDFTRALALAPGDANRLYNRGRSYFLLDEHVRALADFQATLTLNPKDVEAWYMQGACHFTMRNDRLAIMSFDEALRLNPRHALSLFYRAGANYQSGDVMRTLQDLGTLLEADPTHARGLYLRGLARHRTGATALGDADIAAAIKLNPNVMAEVAERIGLP